jgi:uncharacterized protein with HEPN domain
MRRDRTAIADMIDSARRAMNYLLDVDLATFEADVQKQDAVIRRLEVVGEAARRIVPEVRDRFSQVDWQRTILMGRVVVQHYDLVDTMSLWITVKEFLPLLLDQLLAIQADTSW